MGRSTLTCVPGHPASAVEMRIPALNFMHASMELARDRNTKLAATPLGIISMAAYGAERALEEKRGKLTRLIGHHFSFLPPG